MKQGDEWNFEKGVESTEREIGRECRECSRKRETGKRQFFLDIIDDVTAAVRC